MSPINAQELPARRLLFCLPKRVQTWLSSEHAPAQRMAGIAFTIRVTGAGG